MVNTVDQKNKEFVKSVNKDEVVKKELLKRLYGEFEDYRKSEKGIEHSFKYGIERREVFDAFENIKEKRAKGENFAEEFYDLFLRETKVQTDNRVAVVVNNLKNEDEDKRERIISNFMEFIIKLLEEDDRKFTKDLAIDFKKLLDNTPFVSSNRVSTILYYLDDNEKNKYYRYFIINNKTASTVNLLALLLNREGIRANKDYINDNERLHTFFKALSLYQEKFKEYYECEVFEEFDMFCHWMCDANLGAYAGKNAQKSLSDLIKTF